MRVVLLSILLLGACDVGEVPPGGGSTQTPGGGGTTPTGGGSDPTAPDAGGVTGGSGSGQTPDESFNAEVAPLVTRCTGCHSGGQEPNLTSADALEPTFKTKPGAQSLLCTEAADGAQHNGVPYLSTSDKATVAAWIDSLP